MKVTYVALDPLRYPRVKKIAYSLKKFPNVEFRVLVPRLHLVTHGGFFRRVMNAVVNYLMLLLQIFFVKSDIFWVANCPDILVVPLIVRKKAYILEYRSPWPLEVEREIGFKIFVWLAELFERTALNHARVITLTTSKLVARIKHFRKLFFVIPNYPLRSFGKFNLDSSIFREKHGCLGNIKIVLFVGRLTRVEGADFLPAIIENVFKRTNNVVFWIVGDGPFYSELENFSRRYPDRLKLFGWQPYGKIPNFIASADVCIVPRHKSLFSIFYNEEGLQKLSEYMFFKKPIVACGVAKSAEYLLVGEDEVADGILRALRGEVPPSRCRTWEEYSEKKIYEMLNLILSGKI